MRLGANCQICVPTSLGLFQSVQASVAAVDRSGFTSVLPEFATKTCPEQLDAVNMNFQFTTNPAVATSCTYVDSTHLSASLSGASIGALSGTCGGYTIAAALTFSGGRLTGTVTVSRGGMSEVRTLVAGSSGGVVALGAAHYVDSNAADDSANGTSPATPKKTLGALPTLVDGDVVRLARGSRWREELRASGKRITVEAFGAGPRPIVDACNVYGGGVWTKTGGRTNVYQTDVTVANIDNSTGRFLVLQNGIPLKWVASVATCDATTSSCNTPDVAATSGTFTIFVNVGGVDPDGDGKTYEIATRSYGGLSAGSSSWKAIMFRANVHDNGSLVIRDLDDNGDSAFVDDCIALWGNKHNFYISSGSARRSIAYGFQPANTTHTGFVFFRTTAGTRTAYAFDCGVVGDPRSPVSAADSGTGFLAHTGGSDSWSSVIYEQCGAAYIGSGAFATQNLSTGQCIDCIGEYSRSATTNAGWFVFNGGTMTLTRCRGYSHVATFTSVRGMQCNLASTVTATDCLFVDGGTAASQLLLGTFNLSRCALVRAAGAANDQLDDNSGQLLLTIANCMSINNFSFFNLNDAGSNVVASDFNVINASTTKVRENSGKTLRNASAYFSDQAVLDQHSVTTLPTWLAGTDTGDRRTYVETAASRTSRGFDAGPSTAAGSSTWVTPATYDAWLTFAKSL